MPTFGALKIKASKKLLDPSNTAISISDVGDAINEALSYWKNSRFWFNERSTTVTLNVNDPIIPSIPTDFLYEISDNGFVINYNNLSYTLAKVHPREYDARNIKGIGLPDIYTWRDGRYEIYYLPNIPYQLSIYYIRDYDDLSDDADTNDFTDKADRLLYYDALSRLFGEQRQDQTMASYYKARAEDEAANLFARGFNQTASGNLSVDTIL